MSKLSIIEETTIKNKKRLLEALEVPLGIVTTACNSVNIARATHYNWMNDDADYRAAVQELEDVVLDFAESKLMQKIRGIQIGKEVQGETVIYDKEPSDAAIIFYLKTKGKKRGYIERQELTGAEGKDLGVWEIKEIDGSDTSK